MPSIVIDVRLALPKPSDSLSGEPVRVGQSAGHLFGVEALCHDEDVRLLMSAVLEPVHHRADWIGSESS